MTRPRSIEFWSWFTLVFMVAFSLRLFAAVELPNLHRPDEIFQNIEPAFRMWFGGGIVTWEWREGIRSPMFPGFLAGIIGVSSKLGLGPAGYVTAIAAVLSLVSTGTVAAGFLLGWRHSRLGGALVCSVLCAVWPDLVYFGPKPLAEIQAGNLLVIAACVAAYARDPDGTGKAAAAGDQPRVSRQMLLAGFLVGLVFAIRFHFAPALALIAAWTCRLDVRGRWVFFIAGALVPVLCLALIDDLYWGAFLKSVLQNYKVNVQQHVSDEFGVQPFYWFPSKLVADWGAAAVPLAVTFAIGLRRAPMLGAVAILIVLSHSLIAHKEISFIYAAFPPAIIVAGLGTSDLVQWFARDRPALQRAAPVAASAFWLATGAMTALDAGLRPQWQMHANILRAEAMVAKDPELCGLGVRWPAVGWFETGGDAYLGRPIPIYVFATAAGTARVASAANYVLGGKDVADGLPGFSLLRCWSGDGGNVCVARAENGKACIPDPGLDINSVPTLGRMGTQRAADN